MKLLSLIVIYNKHLNIGMQIKFFIIIIFFFKFTKHLLYLYNLIEIYGIGKRYICYVKTHNYGSVSGSGSQL